MYINSHSDTIHYTCAETAKFVREALKKSFPNEKFSVRSKVYSGGASITVSWTDGITEGEVDAIVSKFAGATFDGMIDLKSSVYSTDDDGNKVHYGADYIFCERAYSKEATMQVAEILAKHYNIEVPPMNDHGWFGYEHKVAGSLFTDKIREALFCYSFTAKQFTQNRQGYLPHWLEDVQESINGEPKEMTAVLGQKPNPADWYARSLQQVAAQSSKVIQLDTPPETFPSGRKSTARIDSFKGHPVLIISLPDGQEFSFGVKKAKAILEQLESIQNFVSDREDN